MPGILTHILLDKTIPWRYNPARDPRPKVDFEVSLSSGGRPESLVRRCRVSTGELCARRRDRCRALGS